MMSMAKSWIPTTSCKIKIDVAASNSNCNSSIESKAVEVVGLKILTSKSQTNNHSKPIFQRNQIASSTTTSTSTSCYYNNNQIPAATCFLKSCFLCHKHLSPNKDIYMYRGDQGFCSEECRSRQIYIDDVIQLQIKIKKSRTTTGHVNGRQRHCSNHPTKLHMPSPPVFS